MSKPVKLGWRGGVNLVASKMAIRDDQLAGGKNCWPLRDGELAKRHPVLMDRTAVASPTYGYRALALFVPNKSTGFDIVGHFADGAGGERLIAGTWASQAEASLVQVALATTGNTPATFVNYKGVVIAIVPGTEGFYQLIKDGSDTYSWRKCYFDYNLYRAEVLGLGPSGAVSQVQTTALVKPRVACVYRGRMHYFNFGKGMESWMVAADRSDYPFFTDMTAMLHIPLATQVGNDVLAANGRHFEFAALEGEEILAAEEVSMAAVEGALQTALMVRTNKRTIMCTGELSESTDDGTTYNSYLGDFQAHKVNYDCGIAGSYATCRAPNGTFWANEEDVYVLYDGVPAPRAIGTNIRPALQACPQELRKLWTMAYADGVVFLAIPSANSTSETQLVMEHWRLDLRPRGDGDAVTRPGGPNDASWWGPQDYSQSVPAGYSFPAAMFTKDNTVFTFLEIPSSLSANGSVFMVSLNKGSHGRDIPYQEVNSGLTWAPYDAVDNPTYAVGDVVMPTPLARNGRLYVCTVAGQPGAAEPAWTDADGAVVNDNTVEWTELTAASLKVGPATINDASIAMEPDFKELDLGIRMLDKVFKRGDISAYFSLRQIAYLELILNGGNFKQQAGPVTIGDFTLGRSPAYNDMGLMNLDASAVAQEFQARQFRPQLIANRTVLPVITTPTVIRGRSIQPKLREGAGFIVDDSNDYIVWCSFSAAGLATVQQALVAHGYYSDVDDLMVAVIAALNTGGAMTGFTTNANPWSNDSAFVAVSPYMTTMKFAFTARTAGYGVGFIAMVDPSEAIASGGTTYYVNRSARLLAMLGYDTGEAYKTALGLAPVIGGSAVNLVGEQATPTLASPTKICGVESIPTNRSAAIIINDLEVDLVVKPGRPMPITSRKS